MSTFALHGSVSVVSLGRTCSILSPSLSTWLPGLLLSVLDAPAFPHHGLRRLTISCNLEAQQALHILVLPMMLRIQEVVLMHHLWLIRQCSLLCTNSFFTYLSCTLSSSRQDSCIYKSCMWRNGISLQQNHTYVMLKSWPSMLQWVAQTSRTCFHTRPRNDVPQCCIAAIRLAQVLQCCIWVRQL